MIVTMTVNGEARSGVASWPASLLTFLRDTLALPGSKNACEQGECGSCSVILDGDLVCACLVMAADCDGSSVTTVEGIGHGDGINAVQRIFLDEGAVQCGFCTPGFVVAATHLLEINPKPTVADLREGLAGNICRCTGYGAVNRAIEELVELSDD